MPELPEVETIVQELFSSDLIGIKIKSVNVFWPRSIALMEPKEFCDKLTNQTIENIGRRGKLIVFTLSKNMLLVHLRMTGKFTFSKDKKILSSHERVQLQLSDGRVLHYEDQRKFGKWYLSSHHESKLDELGIEPLSDDFTLPVFQNICQKSAQQIKPFLLNQRHIVGLGNIYVDEALWAAKIHPARKINSLTPKEIKALFYAIPDVLKQGIAHMGTSLGSKRANYFSISGRQGGNQYQLKVFRRTGLPCPHCHNPIIKIVLAQRGTHLCPYCQK